MGSKKLLKILAAICTYLAWANYLAFTICLVVALKTLSEAHFTFTPENLNLLSIILSSFNNFLLAVIWQQLAFLIQSFVEDPGIKSEGQRINYLPSFIILSYVIAIGTRTLDYCYPFPESEASFFAYIDPVLNEIPNFDNSLAIVVALFTYGLNLLLKERAFLKTSVHDLSEEAKFTI